MVKEPTPEQQAVLNYDENIVITARPGSGKTYTVVEKIATVLPILPDFMGVIAISFTNKASDELKIRCRQRGMDAKRSFFGTIDKFYISEVIIPFASHSTNNMPDYEVVEKISSEEQYNGLQGATFPFSLEQEGLLLAALTEGKIFLELTGEIALYLLKNVPGVLKYIKARYTHIFIDEYQDCGITQHEAFLMLVECGLIGIAVGDINQAIFGFANRFPQYLISLIRREDFCHFQLNTNHRCHKSISEYSLALFDISKEIPDEKRVFKVKITGNEVNIAQRIDELLEQIKAKYGVAKNNQAAILCRGNGTIRVLDTALKTAHKTFTDTPLDHDNSDWGRLFCDILYSRFDAGIYPVDIVEQLYSKEVDPARYQKALSMCTEIFSHDESNIKLTESIFVKLAELVYPKKESKRAVELLHETLNTRSHLTSFIPAADDEINLMTLHKSKGLEFNIVFHMDLYKWIIPFENISDEEWAQALNLHYVGITRAIDVCYFMIGTERYRQNYNDFFKRYHLHFVSYLAQLKDEMRWIGHKCSRD